MIVTGLATAAAIWGVLMGVSPMLQIRRMLRQRSSKDVSIGYFAVLLIGFVLWLSYGIAARNLALIVPNAVALLIGASTIAVARQLSCETRGDQLLPRRMLQCPRRPSSLVQGLLRSRRPGCERPGLYGSSRMNLAGAGAVFVVGDWRREAVGPRRGLLRKAAHRGPAACGARHGPGGVRPAGTRCATGRRHGAAHVVRERGARQRQE
jgi:uncharacterized protein with PQ loop repeat